MPRLQPVGQDVANWQKWFFGLKNPKYDAATVNVPEIVPIRPEAPTFSTLLYPDEEQYRHSTMAYLDRMRNLANMNEQTIIYAPPSIAGEVRKMRNDSHWYIISDYKCIWDMPINKFQKDNFNNKQRRLFTDQINGYENYKGHEHESQYDDFTRNKGYDRAHISAVYNAKAFVAYDAVLRNPFGSERWMYVDAGFFDEIAPVDQEGIAWGDVMKEHLDAGKFDRSISISQDTRVVFGECLHDQHDINIHIGLTPNYYG